MSAYYRQYRLDLHEAFPQLVDAFHEWQRNGFVTPEPSIAFGDRQLPLTHVLGLAWNCSDILPGWLYDMIGRPTGRTYAAVARRLKQEMGRA
jgi:hypothetical protein